MRKKNWIALVLALVLGIGTFGMVFAGSFGHVPTASHAAGHPQLPVYQQPSPPSLDKLPVAYRYVATFLWLVR